MKTLPHLFIIAFFLFSGCELISDDDEKCKNIWNSPEYYSFTISSVLWAKTFYAQPEDIVTLKFEGQFYKTYCDGEISGIFHFEREFTNSELKILSASGGHWTYFPRIGMIYNYKFEHDLDEVHLDLELSFYKFGSETKYHSIRYVVNGHDIKHPDNSRIYFSNTNELIECDLIWY